MEKNIVKDKSFQLSLDIIALYKYLTAQKKEFVLSNKISALFRFEPKDVADLWMIAKNKSFNWKRIMRETKTKEERSGSNSRRYFLGTGKFTCLRRTPGKSVAIAGKKMNIPYKALSNRIIGIAIDVHKELGNGFLEKIYENALMVDFKKKGIPAQQQVPLLVNYKGHTLGDFYADIVVDDKIILELKAAATLHPQHETQLLHYLKSSGLRVGYLLNFGSDSKLEFKRMVF